MSNQKVCGIYCILNTANGKRYVGQSVDIARRRTNHFDMLRHQRAKNRHLQSAFTKYGEASFEFRILEELSVDMLDVREKSWISYYRCCDSRFGYNQELGGCLNRTVSLATRRKIGLATRNPSPETREKMRQRKLGRVLSEETKHKMRLASLGRYCSPETRIKIGNAHRGMVFSAEARRKISIGNKGKKLSLAAREKISAFQRTKTVSEATRLRMVAAWVKRREKSADTLL